MRPGGSVLESSASFQRIENKNKRPLLARFFFSAISMAKKSATPPKFLQHYFYGLKMKPNVC